MVNLFNKVIQVNPELSKKILDWNHADHQLYDYFNKTFWQRVEAFGVDKMNSELEAFRAEQKAAETECIQAYEVSLNHASTFS